MTRINSAMLLTLATAVCGIMTSACASRQIPFTHELRAEHNLSAEDIQSLQFYVSDDVQLRREVQSEGHIIRGGQLRVHRGKTIEEVIIEKKTPGIAVGLDEHTITVSFEEGSSLDFSLRLNASKPLVPARGRGFAEPPNPFPGAEFHAPEPQSIDRLGNYFLALDADGAIVAFRGQQFETVGSTYRAHLLIDSEALEEVIEERTVLGGRKLGRHRQHPASVVRF